MCSNLKKQSDIHHIAPDLKQPPPKTEARLELNYQNKHVTNKYKYQYYLH